MSIETRPGVSQFVPASGRVDRKYAPVIRLALISFLVLFFELACIRWFGSTVVFLTFFTNLVLMACFLGVSIGCLSASQPREAIKSVLPLMFATVLLSCIVLYAYVNYGWILVDVGGQGSPQEVYFGTEYRVNDASRFTIPIELIAGVFFVLIALVFVGLGQELGRAFNAIHDRVEAYSANVLGSLAGIGTFMLASGFRTPPFLWFAICIGGCLYFIRRWDALQIASLIGLLSTLAMTAYWDGTKSMTIWSPYYKVTYVQKNRSISTNNISHQSMVSVGDRGSGYALVHLLNRDAGGRPFGNVLVIGAGSGNDVRAALDHGAVHVDAVEIDPVLLELGVADHPGRPYADRRVTTHLDDGRSFLRRSRRSYDLIEYALVDSLVLHSAHSNLRLESFLFTEEAFRDVRSRLKPGGVFMMSNFYRQGWIVARLEAMARKAFGTTPVVLSLPYNKVIDLGPTEGSFTCLLVGKGPDSPVDAIRERFAKGDYFWLNRRPLSNANLNAFGAKPPSESVNPGSSWKQIGPAAVEGDKAVRLPTDDWPYLYLKDPTIPALNLRGMAIVALSSLVLLLSLTHVRTSRLDGRMFFLGAGFMLLETKGVVHLALLFGATWAVNALVFFAVLVMILISNLYVWAMRPQRLWPYYTFLMVALLVNAAIPMSDFLGLPGIAKPIASCAIVFLPIFFAGVIFATVFRDSPRPDLAFGSNIAGVILGGLSENASLIVGMKAIVFVAMAYYLLSAAFGRKADG